MRASSSAAYLYAFVQAAGLCEASYAWAGLQPGGPQQQQRSMQPRRCANVVALGSKVVVTGLGTVTSLGKDVDTVFDGLLDGKCGIGPLTNFDASGTAVKIASEVKDFEIGEYWDPKSAKRYDRYTHLAMAAAKGALADGGLSAEDLDAFRFGVLIGSGSGGIKAVETSCDVLFNKGPKRITPFLLPSIIGNTAGAMVGIELGAKGPNYGMTSACATGSDAIGTALGFLQLGEADVMLAGGTEAAITQLGFAGFVSLEAMTTEHNDSPQTASRPFDAARSGFVMGEGSGVLLLETEEHAKARGAKIYAELAGYAATNDAYNTGEPEPNGVGLANCIRLAMANAGVEPGQVQYVNAHGSSSLKGDLAETRAIKTAFGEHAPKLKVSSTKGATGHLLGAAGGLEAAITCKALATGHIPPTINLDTPSEECDLDYVPKEKFDAGAPLDVAISQNLGFGGHNAALVFKKYEA